MKNSRGLHKIQRAKKSTTNCVYLHLMSAYFRVFYFPTEWNYKRRIIQGNKKQLICHTFRLVFFYSNVILHPAEEASLRKLVLYSHAECFWSETSCFFFFSDEWQVEKPWFIFQELPWGWDYTCRKLPTFVHS